MSFLGLSGRRDRLGRIASGGEGARAVASDAEIRALIEARIAARSAKNWAEADRIRDELVAMGVVMQDAKNPKTGELETSWEIAR